MKCPICREADLVMSDRQGIEIDYCPQCRGVWLDRGELDKIIDRSSSASAEPPPAARQTHRDERYHALHDARPGYREGYGHRKKKGFLGELFDFD
ncbi:MAG TPA: zf-TFIIB domain-containing protein [Oxalicibacterium sp.]|nr:zf-TFIIB domain-containing protein [Oxalicibacterium sp.]